MTCRFFCSCGCGQRCGCGGAGSEGPQVAAWKRGRKGPDKDHNEHVAAAMGRALELHIERTGSRPIAAEHPGDCVSCACGFALGHRCPCLGERPEWWQRPVRFSPSSDYRALEIAT